MMLHAIQYKALLSILVVLLLLDVAAGQFKVVQVERTGLTARAAMAAGTQAYQSGALSDAVGYWTDAQLKYDKLGETHGRIEARINAAAGLQMLAGAEQPERGTPHRHAPFRQRTVDSNRQ